MPLMPFSIVWIWLRGLISIAIIVGAVALLRAWYDEIHVWVPDPVVSTLPDPPRPQPGTPPEHRVETVRTGHQEIRFEPGWNRETGLLAGGLLLATIALAGRLIVKAIGHLVLKPSPIDRPDEPNKERGGEVRTIRRPDGSELHVEMYGPPNAPPIVLTHGWGANATEWYYVKKSLSDQFRLIVWDLPGLGLSKKPDNNDYSLDNLAHDLDAVVSLADGQPVVLLGHSIGGMILLTYARVHAEAMAKRVAGLVLVHTTYTDPIKTMKGAAIKTALEGPVVVPLLHLTIGLWPIVWLMNWLSYLNGSFHRATHKDSFAGHETRGQLNFAASFLPHDRPDVLARGMFGMMHYDATATLPTIHVPTLVVAGDLDITTLPEASHKIANDIPGAQLVTLAPARHMGLIEQNERFNAVVAEFATSCLTRTSSMV